MPEKLYPSPEVSLQGSDLQIGAVEIKNGADEKRAAVDEHGDLHVAETNSAAIQSAVEALDGKVAACDTGAVVVSALPDVTVGSQPDAKIKSDGQALTIHSGSKAVAAAGTAEALLASSTFAWRVDLQAKAANTGKVYVGDSGVDKTDLPMAALAAGEAYSIECPAGCRFDLNTLYVDAEASGEGVWFNYFAIA